MKNFIRLITTGVVVALAVVACSPQGTASPTPLIPTQPIPTRSGTRPAPAATVGGVTPTPAVEAPPIDEILQVQPGDWVRGAEDAAVTFIEWGDFQCPFCADLAPQLKRLEETYPDDVRVVFRHLPLTEIHDKAQIAAEAAEAAGAQDKFWEMHDLLFDTHDDWETISVAEFRTQLSADAEQIGLDVAQFDADLDAGDFAEKVTASRNTALSIGLNSTPFLVVNESPWPSSLPYLAYNNLEGVVKYFVTLPGLQYNAYPEMTIDAAKTYTAKITTDQGDIVIEMYPDKAPLAVNNFVFLAREGWYDNVVFHRVIDGFVAQAGDPTGLGLGGAGYVYDTESSPDLTYDGPGWVGVARTNELNTNGPQFFITRTGIAQEQLDALNGGPYTIFGRVLEGQDVVDGLTVRDPESSPDTAPNVILGVTIEEE